MSASGARVDEIADGLFRISVEVPGAGPTGFTFNQYLLADDAPLLFHTGMRRIFPAVREAVARVLPVDRLRYVAFSHFEADECGSLNEWLAAAPAAVPVCGRVAALTSVDDIADRPPLVLSHGETLALGRSTVRWIDTPHVPHAWECGFLHEERTRTLLCGDLFTRAGLGHPPCTEADILGPSEALRARMGYFVASTNAGEMLERLARLEPEVLACMHGSAWRGRGGALLRELAAILDQERAGR